MRRFFLFSLLSTLFGIGVACADGKVITADALPATAKAFLATNFAKQKVVMATLDSGIFDDEYEVLLDDGTHIEFDRKGEWESIKHKGGALPVSIVPQPIVEFVQQRFAGAKITKIERDNGSYEVDLEGGVDLKFDKNFSCTEVDF